MLLTERVQFLINIIALHCVMGGGLLLAYWLLGGGEIPDDALGVVMSSIVIYGG